jgi:hypothetical protein
MEKVSVEQYAKRMVKLATKFYDYKCTFITYYYDEAEIGKSLDQLEVKYEKWRGPMYNTWGEDTRDFCMALNTNKSEVLAFKSWVYEDKIPQTEYYLRHKDDVYDMFWRLINVDTMPKSFLKLQQTPAILLKDMISTIFPQIKSIIILYPQTLKRTHDEYNRGYRQILKDDDEEKIILNVDIKTTYLKKIKLE